MSKGHLRLRAVAVVIRDGKVLLVRENGRKRYSLPGGGIKHSERPCQAASRELYEETRLRAVKKTWLGSCEGTTDNHKAYLIEARGNVHLNHRELDRHE